jgi:hypothetical protein
LAASTSLEVPVSAADPDLLPAGSVPEAGAPAGNRRRVRKWRVAISVFAVLVAGAAIVLGVLAGTYQPLGLDGVEYGPVAGMPPWAAVRVNTFGNETGQLYVGPRTGPFTIEGNVTNTGPEPVTITAATVAESGTSTFPYPLVITGQAKWFTLGGDLPGVLSPGCINRACPLTGLRLQPGVTVAIALPVRFVYSCFESDSATSLTGFQVREQFGPFSHWVTIAFPTPYLFREPEPSGAPDVTCSR